MLDRVLEPEVMASHEEALAYDAMDHSEVNRRFVDDLIAAYDQRGETPRGEMLDLGAGTAQIPIELCRRIDDARVVAVELSAGMLNMAAANVEAAGLRERIWLDQVDAKRLPYDDGRFDAVISNSIVHHIAQPAMVLAEAWRVVRPGGQVLFRDLLRPRDDATVRRLVDTYAAGASDHARQLFEDSLRAALSLEEIRRLIATLAIDPTTVRQTTDRHWTWQCWRLEA